MGIIVNDSIMTSYGITVSGSYFNIAQNSISIRKEDNGKFRVHVSFNMFNSYNDRLGGCGVLDRQNLVNEFASVPDGNIYAIVYDLFKLNYSNVVDN